MTNLIEKHINKALKRENKRLRKELDRKMSFEELEAKLFKYDSNFEYHHAVISTLKNLFNM